jgi:hypothetical protein
VRVTHAGHQVHVFRARLVPFWLNVAVAVDDGRIAVRASKSAFELGSLVGVLRSRIRGRCAPDLARPRSVARGSARLRMANRGEVWAEPGVADHFRGR